MLCPIFINPNLIESSAVTFITTGGVAVEVDSGFEQEYMIENIKTKKNNDNFFIF
jgi:hypothetical protein